MDQERQSTFTYTLRLSADEMKSPEELLAMVPTTELQSIDDVRRASEEIAALIRVANETMEPIPIFYTRS